MADGSNRAAYAMSAAMLIAIAQLVGVYLFYEAAVAGILVAIVGVAGVPLGLAGQSARRYFKLALLAYVLLLAARFSSSPR